MLEMHNVKQIRCAPSAAVSYPPAAPPAHPVQTAPTNGEMTALTSTPGCQTYTAGRQGT